MAHNPDRNTFAHTMMDDAVRKVANPTPGQDVSNFDRLAVISGSALIEAEQTADAVVALTEAVRDLTRAVNKANGNGNGHRNKREKLRAYTPWTLGGGGLGLLMVRELLTIVG